MHGGFMSHKRENWSPPNAVLKQLRKDVVDAFMSGDMHSFNAANGKLWEWLVATGNVNKQKQYVMSDIRRKHLDKLHSDRRTRRDRNPCV